MSAVFVFETPRHYRLGSIQAAEQTFEWLDVDSGVLDGFYTNDGELLEARLGEDGIYIELASTGRFAAQELADRLASTFCDEDPCCNRGLPNPTPPRSALRAWQRWRADLARWRRRLTER